MIALRALSRNQWAVLIGGAAVLAALTTFVLGVSGARAQRGEKRGSDSAASVHDMHTNECMRSIREIYGRLVAPPSADSVGLYRCRVEVVPKDTTRLKHTVTDLDVANGTARLQVTSDLLTIDRDSVDVFAVVHASGTVFRSDARATLSPFAPTLDLAAVRDSLISRSLLLSCEEHFDSTGHHLRTVRLSPDPYARRLYGLKELILTLDLDGHQVSAMTMVAHDGQAFDKVIWTFSPYQVAPASLEFRAPVARRFLADDHTLTAEWHKYHLVDNRTPIDATDHQLDR